MFRKRTADALLKTMAGLCAAGLLLGGSCRADLEAIAVGLDAAARHMDDNDDEISFSDWLRDELNDL